MDYLKYAGKLKSMQYYIAKRSAVNVDALSSKLEVSRRTILRMVENLRLQGTEIKYCRRKKEYFIE